jgi:hypothetical protein
MVDLISYSSFALPEALLFVTKPKPVEPALLSHFKLLLASFVPTWRDKAHEWLDSFREV